MGSLLIGMCQSKKTIRLDLKHDCHLAAHSRKWVLDAKNLL